MLDTLFKVGPSDHGRHMCLNDFDHAEAQEGFHYELGRGVVSVSDVPGWRHLSQLDELRMQIDTYRSLNRKVIQRVLGGGECKILLAHFESERHPDLSIYKNPAPEGPRIWATWIPEIVVEIVSPTSKHRDYQEKPAEYFAFGVHEYWIVDAEKQEILVMRRAKGQWKERIIKPPQMYCTPLLPGFELNGALVFEAAQAES